MLNESLNYFVVKSLNQFGAGAPLFNKVQFYLESSPLFKSFPLIAILWFYWFREDRERAQRQRLIVCTLAACLLALLVARVINNLGPFQPRPIANSALSLARFAGLPPFQEHSGVRDWSSFPSDHAALFFALAMGIFYLSRPAGVAAIAYVTAFVAFPRVYLGLHYPTDIAGGAAIAMVCVWFAMHERTGRLYQAVPGRLLAAHPALFQTLMLLLTIEMALLFDNVRKFGRMFFKHLA
jgi:membrane-associated phospholipid phosphatase